MQLQPQDVHLLDVESAANYLGVKPRTMRHLIHTRAVPYHKIGTLVRVDAHDLDRYLDANRVEAAASA